MGSSKTWFKWDRDKYLMVNISSNLKSCWDICSWSISISLLVKNKTWFSFCYLIHSYHNIKLIPWCLKILFCNMTTHANFTIIKFNFKLTITDNSRVGAWQGPPGLPGEGAPHEVAVAGADPGPGLVMMPGWPPAPRLHRAVSTSRTKHKIKIRNKNKVRDQVGVRGVTYSEYISWHVANRLTH